MSALSKLSSRGKLALFLSAIAACALCVAPAAKAVKRYRTARFRADLRAAFLAVQRGEESVAMPVPPEGDEGGEDLERDDDAQVRRLANLAYQGVRGPAFHRDLLRIAAEEALKHKESLGQPAPEALAKAARRAELLHAAAARKGAPLDLVEESLHAPPLASTDLAVPGNAWVNLGPANQRFAYNGGNYTALDSGRPNTIVADPRGNGTLYVAFSGGGIWKTFEYGAVTTPTWIPITESLGNLAIGAIDIAKTAPDTLWAGLGDFVDTAGGQVLRSTDGGGTWSAPIELVGVPAGASQTNATTVRDLKIAQDDANIVLVATDVGFFRSINAQSAQPTFDFIDLPNGASSLQEAVWSIAWVFAKTWVATGVSACAPAAPPPSPGAGQPAGSACAQGNLGDLWRSTDDGATWTSARAAGQLTSIESQIPAFGRATLAAAPGATMAQSVLYVFAGTANEAAPATAGILKSANGGSSWTLAAKGTTAVGNATSAGDCATVDVGDGQAWYNQAIAVDPGDPSKVLIGGMLCSARSRDGGATWQLSSHWLPFNGYGTTANGPLPYAHADWHAALIARMGGQVVSFAGTDGGVAVSTNLFTQASSTGVTWTSLNAGLVTHLSYSIGSGDPAFGSQYIVFTGMQDNGTRFRDTSAPTNANTATTFNQVNGGDGFGVAWGAKADGSNRIYWASVYSPSTPRLYCKPTALADCNKEHSFTGSSPALPTGDANPFKIAYSEVRGDPNSAVLSASNLNLWRSNFAGSWIRLTATSQPATGTFRGVQASPYTYTISGKSTRLYGAPAAGGNYVVGTDKAGTLTWTTTATPLGKGTGADAARFLKYTSSIAFPSQAASLGGTLDGQAFLAASVAPVLDDGTTPVPAAMGHLFKTANNGTTWSAFHGNGSGLDLPNVPVNVLRYDTGDATDQTIYAGTDLGLYRTTDGGATWKRFGLGLPMVKVTDIFISKSGELMRVSTFGRGLWELHPNGAYPKGFAGSGDYDLNLAIDFIDLAAMASRLGASPATTSAPYYDWHLDLQGDQSAIDETDLSALLLKFGDRP